VVLAERSLHQVLGQLAVPLGALNLVARQVLRQVVQLVMQLGRRSVLMTTKRIAIVDGKKKMVVVGNGKVWE